MTSIGNQAFNDCSGLTSIAIGNSVTSIGNFAFFGCSNLTSVTIPNSVTSIGESAFGNCSGLKKVIVSDIASWCGIDFAGYLSNPLFYAKCLYSDENTEIKDLIIPNSVTSIGDDAFSGCAGLTSVTIPNSVTSIGYEAFLSCSGLTSITIPNNVTSIGWSAFGGCSGLTSVSISNSITSIGYSTFASCSGLTSITIPNSVTSIGNSVFRGCDGLTSITIPNSVTSIGDVAFANCSNLTSITIGSGIESIGNGAFGYCPELTDVTCYAENVPSTNNNAFKDSYIEYTTLHVPASSVNAYKAAEPWKNFKSIVATDGETTIQNVVGQIPSKAVQIQSEGGILKVEGVDEGTPVSVYTLDGKQVGSAVSRNGAALVGTNIQPGNATIVKIGDKSIKVVMK